MKTAGDRDTQTERKTENGRQPVAGAAARQK